MPDTGSSASVCLLLSSEVHIPHGHLLALTSTRLGFYGLYCAGPELPDVLGAIRGSGSRLGVLHLRRGRGTAVQGPGAAVPQGHGAPSQRE